MQNFSLNWQFWFFEPNFHKKVFTIENRKSEHHHGILHIWISLGTKFQLKLTILIFLTRNGKSVWWNFSSNWQFWFLDQLCPKRYFWSKTEKVSTTYVLNMWWNFSSNWQFWFLDQLCPKRYFQSKTEKVSTNKFHICGEISAQTDNFDFWTNFAQKGTSSRKQKKWAPHMFYSAMEFYIFELV